MRELKFEYGFESINGIIKKRYFLHEIPNIKQKCDVWDDLPIVYVREYTGLKDSEGKEIYEGDLLRFPAQTEYEQHTFNAFEVFWHDNDACDSHIGWQLGRMHPQGNSVGGYHMYRMIPKHTKKLEIIGNIHENPDKLE